MKMEKLISTRSETEIDESKETHAGVGATFTLTSKTDPDKVYTAITDEDGYMYFNVLMPENTPLSRQ